MAALCLPKFQPALNRICLLSSCHIRHYNERGVETAINEPGFSKLKRGRGGRSSFNGVVATVLGPTGFIARYVINKLGKQGSQVIIPYRGDAYDVLRLKCCGDLGQILFFPFHLKDEDSLRKVMKYSNVVINLIGRDFETRNFSYDEVHNAGARRIARIARESGVKKLIHLSSLNVAETARGVILPGGSRFLASKHRGELAVKEEFPEAVIIRPAEVYGQEDRYLRYYGSVWRREVRYMPLWNKGNGIIKQPVWVSDVAKGIMNAIFDDKANGKTFQAIGPRRYELGELVDWFHRVMRKGPEWGYVRCNMKYVPSFRLRVSFINRFAPSNPLLIWDKMEREHTTDVVYPDLPTLEDLGVGLTYMEDQVPWELRWYRSGMYYQEELGEFPDPEPPKVVPT